VEDREGRVREREDHGDAERLEWQARRADHESRDHGEQEVRDRSGQRDEDEVARSTQVSGVDRRRLGIGGRDHQDLHRPQDRDQPRHQAAAEGFEPRPRLGAQAPPQPRRRVAEPGRRGGASELASGQADRHRQQHVRAQPDAQRREVPHPPPLTPTRPAPTAAA
jgi:hypothetical protein